MAWLQISFVVERDSAPLIEAALENSGALAVTLGDAVDEPPLDSPFGTTSLEGVVKAHPWAFTPRNRKIAISRFLHFQPLTAVENGGPSLDRVGCRNKRHPSSSTEEAIACCDTFPWHRTRLTALYPDEPQALKTALAVSRSLADHLGIQPRIERLEDRSWERAWLDDFAPMRFGRRLWVSPKGQAVKAPDAVVVELDPGLAFGTGRHPTTALCLHWLDGAELAGKTVIDYGCGSGILAIAALRLGAAHGLAVDQDPQALEVTQANAEHNGVADRLRFCLPEEVPEAPADLLLANILADPLIALAARLAALVRTGGHIALAGILHDQGARLLAAYAPWFDPNPPRIMDEWMLVSGRRTAKQARRVPIGPDAI
ncbi:MAG: 50S ribosomal protein L11 methyltransferase [Candidatus Thiosymbion ectosymbiont of Robbea hypermnestra]|nr:50S ribosomal protein L11 methyltransferase [Candidatus Thiosymbion ectosymbiont of Robbea hypermnestra]